MGRKYGSLRETLGLLSFPAKEKAVVIQQHQHSPVMDTWYIALEAISELLIRGLSATAIHLKAKSGLYVNKEESELGFPSSKRSM